jgi:hypothetical protein
VLPKTQRNRAVLFRTRFTTIWRSEINIGLKVDDNDDDAGIGFYRVKYVMYVKDSESNKLRRVHASKNKECEEKNQRLKKLLPKIFNVY